MAVSLRARAPFRVAEGFGRAVAAASRWVAPRDANELAELLLRAQAEGLSVAFRGSGRSYGDASLNQDGLLIDTTGWDRMLAWDPQTGIADVQPGLTIEGLWRRTLMDGYWPAVVPGTMAPTIAGCAAMNVHGKNNFKVGSFGEHILELDLLTANGETLRCSREQNADVFHAAIGGLGLLGAFTRIRLRLKHVNAGSLRVHALPTRTLDEMFDVFEERLPAADYLVGWLDCMVGGRALGRGLVHQADYLDFAEDPAGKDAFKTERQTLPTSIMGVPKSVLWRFMRPFSNNLGMRFVNAGKYWAGAWGGRKTYLQSHVGFAFLLDYIPNWRLAYGPAGFIQYQIFAPHDRARQLFRDVIALGRERKMPSYLGVLKRHRPDPFVLTHALDGWSLALDFGARDKERLWRFTEEMSELVGQAGGKFYFAKDAVIRPGDAERAYGSETLDKFFALKQRLDPRGVFSSSLARRVFPRRLASPAQLAAVPSSSTEELDPAALKTVLPPVPKPAPPPVPKGA